MKSQIDPNLCIKCKGKLLCGLKKCPVLDRAGVKFKNEPLLKKDFETNAPSVFVGWHEYPKLNVGILSPGMRLENAGDYDNTNLWVKKKLGINEIINYRGALINSSQKLEVRNVNDRYAGIIQDVVLSKKPLGLEISLNKKPASSLVFRPDVLPMGPSAKVVRVIEESNPGFNKLFSKVYYDTDLKSMEAINFLDNKNVDVNEMTKLLSSGSLGLGVQRKFVPTRWAITAVDDGLGKSLLKDLRNYEVIDSYKVFHGSYLGNYFTILLIPDIWGFELFEVWNPGAAYSGNETQFITDYEFYEGRKTYASNCGGGYYAARLPVIKWLCKNKVQASVLAVREITPEYYSPLGVFVVRQASINAMNNQSSSHNSLEEAKKTLNTFTKFDLRNSRILRKLSSQKKLNSFMK